MRTSLLASFLGLSLMACAGQIDGGGGGGDDTPEDCGDLTVQAGETCDDGNTTDGDGCSATCQTEASPRLDVTVDKPTISTELLTTHMVTVTLTGSDGFSGAATLTASVVDPADQPIPGWTAVLNVQSVSVPLNGTATAIATVTLPPNSPTLTGTLKVTAATLGEIPVGTLQASSAITAANQITIPMKLDANGQCEYPVTGTLDVKVGTKLRWMNNEAAGSGLRITIHIDGNGNGLSHQGDPGSDPQTAYEQTPSTAGGNPVAWYCHAPGPNLGGNNPRFNIIP